MSKPRIIKIHGVEQVDYEYIGKANSVVMGSGYQSFPSIEFYNNIWIFGPKLSWDFNENGSYKTDINCNTHRCEPF